MTVVCVLVGVGARIATAQNSAMAFGVGLILGVIFVFIRLLAICWSYPFLRKFLPSVAKESLKSVGAEYA